MIEDQALIDKLNQFGVDVEKALDDSVRLTAIRVRTTAIKAIRQPSIGTYYRRKGPDHVASKPGDAPNTDTGRLIGSIRMNHAKLSQSAEVGTDLDYGAFLELLMGRPWLQPSLDRHIPDFEKVVYKAVDKQIQKAGR